MFNENKIQPIKALWLFRPYKRQCLVTKTGLTQSNDKENSCRHNWKKISIQNPGTHFGFQKQKVLKNTKLCSSISALSGT